MKEFRRLNPKLSKNDIIFHSKGTISIPSDDNESVTDSEKEYFHDNDKTPKSKATEDIIFPGSKKYINPDIFNLPVIKLSSVAWLKQSTYF